MIRFSALLPIIDFFLASIPLEDATPESYLIKETDIKDIEV